MMGETTNIGWTDHTFNPWIGCAKVSPGCANCYASVETYPRVSRARGIELWGKHAHRHITSDDNWRKPLAWNRDAAALGVRRRVFCASLADVFEDRGDLEPARTRLAELVGQTPHLDWLFLTKRPENAVELWRDACGDLVTDTPCVCGQHARELGGSIRTNTGVWAPNLWIGTTVENQLQADARIPHLLRVPAAVRFLSCEPLLEAVNLADYIAPVCACDACGEQSPGIHDLCPLCEKDALLTLWGADQVARYMDNRRYEDEGPHACDDGPQIHWVIVGGESGPKARPFDLDWAVALRDQCATAGVPFFMKQIGARPYEHITAEGGYKYGCVHPKGEDMDEWPTELRVQLFPTRMDP